MVELSKKLKEVAPKLERWWNNGDQSVPCVLIQVLKDDHETIPDNDNLIDYWTNVNFVIDRQIKLIDNTNYYGQAVPFHFVDFGASAMPIALGAEPEYVSKDTIWAHPKLNSIEEITDLVLDESNPSYKVILETTRQSIASAHNHHMASVYPLNGITDIMAGLYGTENLLMDFIIKPDQVKSAMKYFKTLWIKEFNHIQSIMNESGNLGGIGWAGIWSPGTTFPIQEDLTYMISSEMYREFCLPHVRDIIDCMDYSLYHLDGIGAIPHLDTLLEIENLNAIQWVPGAGKEKLDQWYDLIKRILKAGKSVQIFAQPDEVGGLVDNVGPKGLLITVLNANNEQAEKLINDYCPT
jgi:hypothetical protein